MFGLGTVLQQLATFGNSFYWYHHVEFTTMVNANEQFTHLVGAFCDCIEMKGENPIVHFAKTVTELILVEYLAHFPDYQYLSQLETWSHVMAISRKLLASHPPSLPEQV